MKANRAMPSILTALGALLLCAAAAAHSPHDNVRTVAVSPAFASDRTVFCSMIHLNTYVLRSTNGGLTWRPSQIGLPNESIAAIVMSPQFAQDGVVFAATNAGKVFRSNDSGASWTSQSAGLPALPVRALALSPLFPSDGTLFAGLQGGGVFKSTDAGASWTPCSTGLTDLNINALALSSDFGGDRTLFCGTGTGIFKSTDAGLAWVDLLGVPAVEVTSISVSPMFGTDRILFAGTWGKGVHASADGGLTWQARDSGITDRFITDVGLSPDFGSDRIVLASTKEGGVFKSVSAGAAWHAVNHGLDEQSDQTDIHYYGFGFSPGFANDGTVFLAGFEGLHKSKTGGSKWRQLYVFNQKYVRTVAVSPAFAADGTVFAGSYGGGIYRSEDRGATWKARTTGLIQLSPGRVVPSPDFAQDRTVFIAATECIFKSATAGDAWMLLNVDPANQTYIRHLDVSPDFAFDQTIFASNEEGIAPHLSPYQGYRSIDGGLSFQPLVADYKKSFCMAVSPDYAADRTVFNGTGNGVYRTVDSGATWQNVGLQGMTAFTVAVSPAFDSDGVVLAGTWGGGVHRSSDGGGTWNPSSTGITDDIIMALAVSPGFETDSTAFAATKSGGIFRSVDGGITWSLSGLRGEFLRAVALSPSFPSDGTLFLAGWEGVHRSTDGGLSWNMILNFGRYDATSQLVEYSGSWTLRPDPAASGRGYCTSSTGSDRASMIFAGTSIAWIGERASMGGYASVFIDGGFQGRVDVYSASPRWQEKLFEISGLSPGAHIITVVVDGAANPASTGHTVFVDAFDVES
jgi:photosystem II stability/assembly factor-like uncharacterized protein